jgi:hypothetical protein
MAAVYALIMRTAASTFTAVSAALLTCLPLIGCSIDVQKHDGGRRADVDIRALGNTVAVRTAVSGERTGFDIYPGATLADRHHGGESADVDIQTAWFGVKVVAATYESDDSPERVLAFYRSQMQDRGDFIECRGKVDFKWRSGASRPVCRERSLSREVKLVAGSEDRQRIISVKPHRDGTEFSLVAVATND